MPFGNRFVDLLSSLRRGTFLEDAADELTEVMAAVRATGKPGEITVKLKITPQKFDASVVTIADTITLKAPKGEVADTIAYVSETGEISRRDPRQPELPVIAEVQEGSA